MYRYAIEELKKWKANQKRKPLIIRGARQVGKTWLMKEFGSVEYDNTVYISFDNNPAMQELFALGFDLQRIITGLELSSGQKIKPETTLLIFDEIQEVPQALTALKYFCENAPQYQIIAAGSLLGVALHPGTSFPVGKVEFLDLYPLSFKEFMLAMGARQFADMLEAGDFEMVSAFRQSYIELLKYYYFTGGMPEVVLCFAENRDFAQARYIQQQILAAYEQDFSKHAPNEAVPRIRMLWNSIPAQLSRENKKFIYGLIKNGARAREYELALLWLSDCGLIHTVRRVTKPGIPLTAYEDPKAFKVYLADVGLLACMAGLGKETLLEGNQLFKEFKGALTEQYVLEQLVSIKGVRTCYWSNDAGNAEVDFVLDTGRDILPLEVKAEENLQSKSLKVYREKYSPTTTVRVSMANYRKEASLLNLPLYAISEITGKAID